MDPLMVQLTQTIHDERVQNMAKRRHFNAFGTIDGQTALLPRLSKTIANLVQRLNMQSLSAPVTSTSRS